MLDILQFVAENNISIKAIDSTSIATITSIAKTDTRISAQARTMLSQILDSMQSLVIISDTGYARLSNDVETMHKFNLLPNPANQTTTFKINFELNLDAVCQIQIMDMLGKLHQQITINNPFEQQLSLASIVDGIYIVKLYVNNEVLDTQRLVITKN